MVSTVLTIPGMLQDDNTKASLWQMIMCLVLASCYAGLAFFSSFQLFKIIFYRHNCASFQVPFVILSFLWTSIRAIFFGLNLNFTQQAEFGVFWVTNDLELTMYILIVLFYIYWIQDEDAKRLTLSVNTSRFRLVIKISFIILVLFMFTKTFVMLSQCDDVNCEQESEGQGRHLQHVTYYFRAFEYLTLLLVYTFIMVLIQHRRRKLRVSKSENRVMEGLSRHGTLKNTIVGRKFMMMFWLIFASRFLFFFVTQGKVWTLDIALDVNLHKLFSTYVFILLILWEIFPTSIVLWCFRSIPSTNAGGCKCLFWKNENYLEDYSSDVRYKPKVRPAWGIGVTRNRDSNSLLSISSSVTMNQPSLPITCSPPMLQSEAPYNYLEEGVVNSGS